MITAESGPDAIDALERNPDIDLVLMDIMMPVMDGYTAIRKIRGHDQFKSIPIIAVTGKVVPGERERCLDAGANDYVPKPVNTAELLVGDRAMATDRRLLHGIAVSGGCATRVPDTKQVTMSLG